jgi:uncharacterized protein (TIGR02147 family)
MSKNMPQIAMEKPNIFNFMDFREFLRAYFDFCKLSDPGFSMRTFLGKISHSLSSSGVLSAVIAGRRPLGAAFRLKLAKTMDLKDKEQQYFKLLVQFNQAKDMEEKNQLFRELSRFRESKAKQVSQGQYNFYSKWYYLVVWCYFGMVRDQKNPHEIARRIYPALTAAQVEESVRVLLELGLIKRLANGYAPTENHVTTEKEVADLIANQHHKEFIGMAGRMLDEVPAHMRQFNTLVFSISKPAFETVKERIETFQEELREILSHDQGEEMIYALNMQLYPHSRWETSKPGKEK